MPACARFASVAFASPLWQVVHVSVFFGWASSIPRWQIAHWSGRAAVGDDASAAPTTEAPARARVITSPRKTRVPTSLLPNAKTVLRRGISALTSHRWRRTAILLGVVELVVT